MSPIIKVDEKLCISGIKRYNSRSQGAKKIMPTLIRALKLYEPKLENISLILTPPYNLQKAFSKRCKTSTDLFVL